jgi:2-amino-4-hydroxy-6-hydroxymethyldihydropteridine diphosphokinase
MVVYLGLGSNAGNRARAVLKAIKLISLLRKTKLLKVSSFYITSPVGPKQRDFINAAAKIKTGLSPDALLAELKDIEAAMGRKKSARRWGPRPIDIDILFFGRQAVSKTSLTIPHPELHERRFVLEPLSEIAPRLFHPVLKKTVAALKAQLLLTYPEQKVRIII